MSVKPQTETDVITYEIPDNVVALRPGDAPLIQPQAQQVPEPAPVPVNSMSTITVNFGPNSQEFQVSAGSTIGAVLNNMFIKEIIGFTGKETVNLNGRPSTPGHVLNPGDQIEFIKEDGRKN